MTKHWLYLKYVLRHKWFVLQAGRRLSINLWQLLVHDLSKFHPSEWFPYAEWFYGYNGGSWYNSGELVTERRNNFDRAWLLHLHRNPHHWQYWVLHEDSGVRKVMPMPERYRHEMIADWAGAGRAIHGDKSDMLGWYESTKDARELHPDTRRRVEIEMISVLDWKGWE